MKKLILALMLLVSSVSMALTYQGEQLMHTRVYCNDKNIQSTFDGIVGEVFYIVPPKSYPGYIDVFYSDPTKCTDHEACLGEEMCLDEQLDNIKKAEKLTGKRAEDMTVEDIIAVFE